jgi:hypothetical protein
MSDRDQARAHEIAPVFEEGVWVRVLPGDPELGLGRSAVLHFFKTPIRNAGSDVTIADENKVARLLAQINQLPETRNVGSIPDTLQLSMVALKQCYVAGDEGLYDKLVDMLSRELGGGMVRICLP